MLVITDYQVITLRSGLMTGYRVGARHAVNTQIARDAPILDMTLLSMDDSEKVTIQFGEWGIVFHTLYTEQLVVSLLNRYNALCTLVPADRRAAVHLCDALLAKRLICDARPRPTLAVQGQVGTVLTTHNQVGTVLTTHNQTNTLLDCTDNREAYVEAVRAYYAAMCDKYRTQRLSDVEEDLADRITNGSRQLVLDSARRSVDALQAAALLETLRWDEWFERVCVKDIGAQEPARGKDGAGQEALAEALAAVLGTSQTLRELCLDGVKLGPKVGAARRLTRRRCS